MSRRIVETDVGPVLLAPHEELVEARHSPVLLPASREDPLGVLCRMGGVDHAADLGRAGPLVGATANPENANSPELRRYEARFGRDAFHAADFLSDLLPGLEQGTVLYFAAYQARAADPRSLATIGKIPNHVRSPDDPLARRLTAKYGRRWPWFGGMDTTVQFLSAACRVLQARPEMHAETLVFPGDAPQAGHPVRWDDQHRTLGDALVDALKWLTVELDAAPRSGLVWVGLNRNDSFQYWVDSPHGFCHRDGRPPTPPLAPLGLQAMVYDALMAVAALADDGLDRLDAADAHRRAERVRASVIDAFMVRDDRGTFLAAGLDNGDAAPRPVASRIADMGFALDSSVLDPSHGGRTKECELVRDTLVDQLTRPELASQFGIVGRARDEVTFAPFDYHAQAWAFASYKAARGLRRSGRPDIALRVERGILRQTDDGLLPENVSAGIDADDDRLQYCQRLVVKRRPAPGGAMTTTVTERPPAPYAAWTAAAVVAIQKGSAAPHGPD
jgi:glycogen debranching enzyme